MAEETLPPRGSIEAKDPFAMAPPGYGLTSDNERWPWGKPQEEVNPEEVLRQAVESLKVPHVRDEMMKLLMIGASVEALVEGYVFQAFQEGGFSPDVGLLIKGPLGIYIANMAEEANIPYRLLENDDALTEDEMDDARMHPAAYVRTRPHVRGTSVRCAPDEATSALGSDRRRHTCTRSRATIHCWAQR